MSDQVHTIPDDTAAHYERLITEAEKMRQAGADALKTAYADLRADLKQLGWSGVSISAEVAAFKGAIAEMALAEADKTKRDEKGERIDDYVSLLTRARARGARVSDAATNGRAPSLTTREAEGSVVSNPPVTATMSLANGPCDAASERTAGEAGGEFSDLPTNSDQLSKGGEGAQHARHELTSTTGEGAASALPAKSRLRPLCRNPGEKCGG